MSLEIHLCCVRVLAFCSNKYYKLWLSVLIINELPIKYEIHFLIATTNPSNSFSYVESYKFFPLSAWLRKAIGLLLCMSTTPISSPLASHSITTPLVKSNKKRIGEYVITSFKCWKASSATEFQTNASFFSKVVKGATIWL